MGTTIRTLDGHDIELSTSDVDRLRGGLRGELLTAFTAGYDEARTIWNAMIDRRPALIARCRSAADVSTAVRFAAERRLMLSVRGGGHNIAGNAVCESGLMIDVSPMSGVEVNESAREARVESGATLGDFDSAAQKFALATPLGVNSTTGVAGLTLGGGWGWLSRRLGLTVDSLLEADVVMATGEHVKASERENADLFWAIRGGGGNYGVVTSFRFRLHEVGPEVLSGLIVHPLEDAPKVLRFLRDFLPGTSEDFVCWFVLRLAPPLPFLPPEWHGKAILALAVCCTAPIDEAQRIAKPLRSFGKPIADVIAPHAFVAWQQILDPLLVPGARNYWKSHDFASISDGLIDTLVDYATRIPDPQTEIAFAQLGGAITRVPIEATAYGHRNAEFALNVHGRWSDPAKDAACIDWARALYHASAPFSTGGVYVNFLTQEEGDRIRFAYGVNYDRAVTLKSRYDPMNLFRMNQNIKPATTAAI